MIFETVLLHSSSYLGFAILLPQPQQYWDYKHALLYLASDYSLEIRIIT